ncbi:hypothetical protein PENTCL1PPCAC_5762 [Pristionchus entomophagus]|uniref:G protein-coupled receptor n=1 Tax=Pristionchus entomophagus TaxID=358040 RepID=A0AAV5SLP0_9BILA|nr:hypothetical protein PENTCL1PPCAC_5762 [Pristionchus entomophagus]
MFPFLLSFETCYCSRIECLLLLMMVNPSEWTSISFTGAVIFRLITTDPWNVDFSVLLYPLTDTVQVVVDRMNKRRET